MLRLFTGLALPQGYQDGLAQLRRTWQPQLGPLLKLVRDGNWHVTLKYLGSVAEQDLDGVKQALAGVRFEPFTAQAGGCGTFPPRGWPRVLWVGMERGAQEMAALAASVDRALEPLGYAPQDRPFHAHLTLARINPPGRTKSAEHTQGDSWPEVIARIATRQWEAFEVQGFTLWRSVLGPGGPRYTSLVDYGATSL
ncbi:MAG: RNA 2',3'-cyclic phosphodiesterase [Proteobacteria bacterium]|nr:RNA 2',3'-cyclic phosphodiesterase [Pseudomonadota bacterium]